MIVKHIPIFCILLSFLVNAETVLKVADCIEESSGNVSVGIRYCLDMACKDLETGPVTVLFPPKATLSLTGTKKIKLVTKCCTGGLTLDGNGVTLIQTNPFIGVWGINGCDSVIIKNFTIDYNPLPFTQGRVKRKVSKTEVEIAIDPGFPSPMDYQFTDSKTVKWGVLRENTPPYLLLKLNTPTLITIQSWSSGGVVDGKEVYTVNAKWFAHINVTIGDPWIHVARYPGAAVVHMTKCTNVSFEDITIYTAPGESYCNLHSSDIAFTRCRTIVKPGRWWTTNADGIMSIANRNGPKVKDCVFEAIGDDALIFKTNGYSVKNHWNNGRTLVLTQRPGNYMPGWDTWVWVAEELLRDFVPPIVGDILAAYNPESGTYLGNAEVIALEEDDLYNYSSTVTVNLDVSFDGLEPGTEWYSSIIYNLNTTSNGFEVSGTTIYSSRRWGVLTMGKSGTVTNNKIIGNPSSAIMIINSGMNFRDSAGFANTDLSITNNVFSDSIRSQSRIAMMKGQLTAVVSSAMFGLQPPTTGTMPRMDFVSWRGHQNIRFVNNTISQMTGDFPTIMLRNIDGGLIAQNIIRKNGTTPGLSLFDAKAITVTKNTFHDGCIFVDKDTVEDTYISENILPSYCN